MTIFIIDGTNPIMDAVGDHPTERSITLQNNGLSDITEPFTQVLVQAGQKVTFTLIGDEAHKQLLDNLDQINGLKVMYFKLYLLRQKSLQNLLADYKI